MNYALKLATDNRILSAWKVLPNGNYDGMPIVDTLPEGNLPDYLYVNGEYVYDPLPVQEPPAPEPTVWDELDAAYQSGYTEGYQEGVNTAYDNE